MLRCPTSVHHSPEHFLRLFNNPSRNPNRQRLVRLGRAPRYTGFGYSNTVEQMDIVIFFLRSRTKDYMKLTSKNGQNWMQGVCSLHSRGMEHDATRGDIPLPSLYPHIFLNEKYLHGWFKMRWCQPFSSSIAIYHHHNPISNKHVQLLMWCNELGVHISLIPFTSFL